jgi:hypothetical protein
LNEWGSLNHAEDPYDAVDPSRLTVAEKMDEGIIDPTIDVSETGATNNDSLSEANAMYTEA